MKNEHMEQTARWARNDFAKHKIQYLSHGQWGFILNSSRIRKNKLIKKLNTSTPLKEKRKITQKRLDPALYF